MDNHYEMYFDGGLFQLLGWSVLGAVVTTITLGLCFPWVYTRIYAWETNHTFINGTKIQFDGNAKQLFKSWVKWLLLIIITFGFYLFCLPAKLDSWRVNHTSCIAKRR